MDPHTVAVLSVGFVAACLTLTSDLMKSMLPLRAIALAANLLFALFFYLEGEPFHMTVHLLLLPVNAKRLWDIQRLVRGLREARADMPLADWLVPHMARRRFQAGETLFRKGDRADEMIYIAEGRVRLVEHGQSLGVGALLGEIGLFAPERTRTQTVVCETDGELYRMTEAMMVRLYYQNPRLGFYLMRLVVRRLLHDVQVAETTPRAA